MEHFDDVDAYLACDEQWHDETVALREVVLATGLDESIKWGKPCYSHEGANIVLVQPFKHYVALMYFKGALMDDPVGVLADVGPNSRSAKRIEFSSVDDVTRLADTVRDYIAVALEVEASGIEPPPVGDLDLAPELQDRLDADAEFKAAFEGLTPGRQRAYNLEISGAKKAETRAARVEKYAPKILAGKGLRDR